MKTILLKFIQLTTFPLLFVGSVSLYPILESKGLDGSFASFVATVISLISIAIFEQLMPLKKITLFQDKQSVNDVFHGLFSVEVGGRLAKLITELTFVSFVGQFARKIWPVEISFGTQIILVFFSIDFLFYWQHRLFHKKPLWNFHSLHHNPTEMHVLKGARLHFFEIFLRHLFIFGPVILLGAPHDMIVYYITVTNILGNLSHSNLNVKLPDFLHWVLVTPEVHHIHHAKESYLCDSNYGGFTTIYDILFGTFYHPNRVGTYSYGIVDDFYSKNFFIQLLQGFGLFRSNL